MLSYEERRNIRDSRCAIEDEHILLLQAAKDRHQSEFRHWLEKAKVECEARPRRHYKAPDGDSDCCVHCGRLILEAVPTGPKELNLNLDVSSEGARALHRVVRAMHDGHCPKCGFLAHTLRTGCDTAYECSECDFKISDAEAAAALATFAKYMSASVAIFERWRAGGWNV